MRWRASWVSAYALTNDYAAEAAHFVRRRSPLVQDISQEDVPAVAAVYYEMTSPARPMASLYGDEVEGTQRRSQGEDPPTPPRGAVRPPLDALRAAGDEEILKAAGESRTEA